MIKFKLSTKNFWRFYLYTFEENHYCFDCFTHKIYTINSILYTLLKFRKLYLLRKKFPKFYTDIILQKAFIPVIKSEEKCCIAINYSNRCNLKCSYCYRDKNDTSRLTKENLEEIIFWATNVYMPNAKQYCFSLGFTSEPSLELDYLKYFDKLIGKHEGYLFSEKNFTKRTAKDLFEQLPTSLQSKYKIEKYDSYIVILNEILYSENLWEYYDFSENGYANWALSITKNLSISKKIAINRMILNHFFPDFKLEEDVKFFSMWYMTNGTNITPEFINFTKSILMTNLTISIDGPELIHNANRKFSNGIGSYNKILKGIKELHKNGISVTAAIVITPKYTDLEYIVRHFINENIDFITFGLVRAQNKYNQFTRKNIDSLISSIKNIYDTILADYIANRISKFQTILKKSILFNVLVELYERQYKVTRCHWGQEITIDSRGNLYHCSSLIKDKKEQIGSYKDNSFSAKNQVIPLVTNQSMCKKCYAKFLCGGTCLVDMILGNKKSVKMECYFRKKLINEQFRFYSALTKYNYLDKFIENLGD